MMTSKLRILVVDDSVLFRSMVCHAIEADAQLHVAGVASNGMAALRMIEEFHPDAITLDLEMPVMNGLETLRHLRKAGHTLPVIVLSALTKRGAMTTLDALAAGASDYVTKPLNANSPEEGVAAIRNSLVPKLKALCYASSRSATLSKERAPVSYASIESHLMIKIIVIGTSTGGPNALAEVIPQIPADFPVPVLVVQHMPPVFTAHLAERLNNISQVPVCEGRDGARLIPGEVWLAPGGYHMALRCDGGAIRLAINQQPPENSCRPSVDVTFRSVAEFYGPATLAVVLTGMGQDGLRGSEVVHKLGGEVYAQDEMSSVVWGMPSFVAKSGLAAKILPLNQIASQIVRRVQRYRGAGQIVSELSSMGRVAIKGGTSRSL